MPIIKQTFNISNLFGGKIDPKLDKEVTKVISPEKSNFYDLETFTYFIESWQKTLKIEDKESMFKDVLIDYRSDVLEPFYVFLKMNFSEWADETISAFIYEGKVEYWPDNYFENKYGKTEAYGYIIHKEDYDDAIVIKDIAELYKYIYDLK
jgi:hypothetical protein